MSLTVGEVKENAIYNFKNANTGLGIIQVELGNKQMANYEKAIELGASDDDDWEEWENKIKEN